MFFIGYQLLHWIFLQSLNDSKFPRYTYTHSVDIAIKGPAGIRNKKGERGLRESDIFSPSCQLRYAKNSEYNVFNKLSSLLHMMSIVRPTFCLDDWPLTSIDFLGVDRLLQFNRVTTQMTDEECHALCSTAVACNAAISALDHLTKQKPSDNRVINRDSEVCALIVWTAAFIST